jgi:hypothetical protein
MSDADSNSSRVGEDGWANDYAAASSTLDRAFGLLASRRRRLVIAKLRSLPNGVASVEDLADHLLVRNPDADGRDRTLIALQHRTLPRLDGAGVIDFDRRTDTVRYHGNELVEELLDFVADENE